MKLASALALVGLATLAGCQVSRWTPLPPAPETFGTRGLHEVRVTRTDGSQLTLFDVVLVADTLRGLTNPTNVRTSVAVPLRDVRALDARRVNGGASAGLSVAVFLGVLGAVGIAVWAASAPSIP